MKNLCKLLPFFLTFFMTSAQDYKRMIAEGAHSVFEIQQVAETYFTQVGIENAKGYKQYKRWEYQALQNMDENGLLKTPEFYYNELERYNSHLNQNFESARTTVGSWEELGPNYWDATASTNPGVGRITAIAIDPENTNHIIIGSETGGVWKTLDGGANWIVLTDNLFNIDVYSLTMDPTNSSTYFWGSNNTILKSVDGGSTWNLLSTVEGYQINKIVVDYNEPNIMYYSSAYTGVYRSNDSGVTWTKIHPSSTSGHDIEFKRGDPSIVYASGNDFFKSTDSGETFTKASFDFVKWTQEYLVYNYNWKVFDRNGDSTVFPKSGANMAILSGGSTCSTRLITESLDLTNTTSPQLKFSHTQVKYGSNQDELRVLYKTSASGNWIELAHYTAEITTWQDEVIDLPNPSNDYYIAFEGTRSGGRWVTLDDVAIEDATLGIIFSENFDDQISHQFSESNKMIGVSPNDPAVVYIVESDQPYGYSKFGGIHRSDDEGESFTKLDHPNKNYFGYSHLADDDYGQAPRDMDIAVNPYNVDEVHIAGINTWRSTNGGVSFTISSYYQPEPANIFNVGYCHADVDLLMFVGSDLYVGSDGGIFVAEDIADINTDYYRDLSAGLGIRQFYKIGLSQTNPSIVLGGSQDNGTSFLNSAGNWKDWIGQDGMECFVDKSNNNVFYGSHQFGNLYKSTDGGTSYVDLGSPENKSGSWVTPFEQDPILQDVIYSAYDTVYKSIDGGNSWLPISQSIYSFLNELKIAPSNNNIIYTSGYSVLYKTIDGGATDWVPLTGFSGAINSIAIHPTNPNKIAIATTGTEKVYVSNDGGVNWTSYLHNLPNFSARALTWHDNGNDGLYLGTQYGGMVFYIDNTLTEWQQFGNGLPNVAISELEINTAENKIYAATYGRGLWSSSLFDETLDISDLELNSITMYPNPANKEVTLKWDNQDKATIRIYDALGKLMFFSKNEKLNETKQINISNYASGLYFVKINTINGIVTKKLTVK